MGKKDKKKQEPKEEPKEEHEEQDHEQEQPAQEAPEQDESQVEVLKPKKVQYCPVCTLPFELCKYGKKAKDCKKFLMEIAPAKVEKYHPGSSTAQEEEETQEIKVEEEEKKPKESKKDKSIKDKYIVIDVKQRAKKKFTTTVTGLQIFKIDSKDLTKKLSKKFACSCSAQDSGSAVIQGDFEENLRELLITEYAVKKKYILNGEEFKVKQGEEKEKKKLERQQRGEVIPEEPEEEEKKAEEVADEGPKYKTEIQKALAEMGEGEDDDD